MFATNKNYTKPIIGIVLFLVLIVVFVEGVRLVENRQWAGNLTGMHHSSLAMGDFNNDNKTDLVLIGCTAGAVTSCTSVGAYVYINNGTTLTHNLSWSQNLTAVGRSSIAIGDIDNDGDLDLIVAGSSDYSTADATRVYINNGTAFVANQSWQQNVNYANVYGGSIALGDVNNDGWLDLAMSGADTSGYEGIYLNNGSSFNKDYTWTPSSFPNGGKSLGLMALSWVDLDGDSRLDLVVMGSYSTTFYTNIYTNNGTSLVQNTSWEQNIALSLGWPSIAFGDYDSDGDIDMGYIGTRVGDRFYIYNNEKNSFSSNQTDSGYNLAGYFDGSIAFGDYDNDGDLDIIAMGKESGRNRIYLNNNTLFQIDTIVGSFFQSENLQQGSLLWNDIDTDGDIDLISIGKIGDTSTLNATSYINNASLTANNSIPYTPSTFDNHSLANGDIFLGWNNGNDNETASLGLYYNLRVGTTSGGNQIVSGVFGSSSRPTAGYFGNMMQRRNISLSGARFQVGTTYYWSVQTIDTGLAKSAWSSEMTFNLTSDFIPPTITLNAPSGVISQTSNILFNATVVDDYAVSNVSFYGNWSGGWHKNQTNNTCINNMDYIFNANLSEGEWLWGISSCDTTNNCKGSNATIRIDITNPAVALVSPANGSSQTSSNAITFTYNVSDVAINNCTLYLNGVRNETDTSITVSTSQTFAENVPNGNYNWSVRCADAANNINTTANFSLTISYTPSETPASTSGGGGGGGGGGAVSAAVTKVTRIIAAIAEGNNLIEFAESEKASVGVEEIMLNSAAAASNVKIIIEKLAVMPASIATTPTGDVYSYLQFNKTVLKDEDVKEAKITFNVLKSWVLSKGADPEKVKLSRYTTKWEALPTQYIRQNGSYYYYESRTPGFSVFAITAEKKQEEQPITAEKANKTEEKPVIPAEEVPKAPEEAMKRLISPAYLVIIGVIIIILIIIARLKPKKR